MNNFNKDFKNFNFDDFNNLIKSSIFSNTKNKDFYDKFANSMNAFVNTLENNNFNTKEVNDFINKLKNNDINKNDFNKEVNKQSIADKLKDYYNNVENTEVLNTIYNDIIVNGEEKYFKPAALGGALYKVDNSASLCFTYRNDCIATELDSINKHVTFDKLAKKLQEYTNFRKVFVNQTGCDSDTINVILVF